jgi:hypothetical protein
MVVDVCIIVYEGFECVCVCVFLLVSNLVLENVS